MRHEFTLAVAALALTTLVGCGDDDPAPVTDLGVRTDLGPADMGVETDAGPTDAGAATYEILDPTMAHTGHTYSEWASEWWKWAYEMPWTTNALNDTTGANCLTAQTHDAFFLAGTFGGDATRTCTIPAAQASKPIFFPIFNYSWDNCGVPPTTMTDAELMAALTESVDSATSMSLVIDGVTVGDTVASLAAYRTAQGTYSYTIPAADSVYDHFGSTFEGLCSPSYQSGYWMMLAPLPAGTHHIHFHAGTPGTPADPDAGIAAMPWSLDVDYTLTVE